MAKKKKRKSPIRHTYRRRVYKNPDIKNTLVEGATVYAGMRSSWLVASFLAGKESISQKDFSNKLWLARAGIYFIIEKLFDRATAEKIKLGIIVDSIAQLADGLVKSNVVPENVRDYYAQESYAGLGSVDDYYSGNVGVIDDNEIDALLGEVDNELDDELLGLGQDIPEAEVEAELMGNDESQYYQGLAASDPVKAFLTS